jgi:hypothetical protein
MSIDEQKIRAVPIVLLNGLVSAPGLTDDLESPGRFEDPANAQAIEWLFVDDEHPPQQHCPSQAGEPNAPATFAERTRPLRTEGRMHASSWT